ncbi:patatin-like phospholipase family protein [Rhodopseudomonas palustris]|uniref:patatin-like phospholipase family protein n=1 Tax=Rhodopseudomonas palustris TaxID=1076 RepID=UPI0020CCC1B6|nr:patatin-like phospholipase family protein [Rhodopseudomonas palustris]MCP9626341.1 patatin-like phospholipase family protein [Rhodopseudomonas palustris]
MTDRPSPTRPDRSGIDGPVTALVFGGGLSLAAYHGGAYQAFANHRLPLHWVAGSSAGAITAALIAGNAAEHRVPRLLEFWGIAAEASVASPFAHFEGWVSALRAHVVGDMAHFYPRFPSPLLFHSLYDLAPMRRRLSGLIDFARLNGGETRLSVATTDLRSGDPVIFDTACDRIELDHLLASCGFLPEFAPVTIGTRTLGDGGLSLNSPFDPIMQECLAPLRLFVLDLYARDDRLPSSFEAALERKNDLLFGNQTYLRLKDKISIRNLQRQTDGTSRGDDEISLLSYRAGADEPGPEKSFNFSRAALSRRWRTGRLDMEAALDGDLGGRDGLRVIRREAGSVTDERERR